jgi:hypothetical protein
MTPDATNDQSSPQAAPGATEAKPPEVATWSPDENWSKDDVGTPAKKKAAPAAAKPDTFDSAKAAATQLAPGIDVRSEHCGKAEILVYSAGGVDLLERAVGAAAVACLKDVPRCGMTAGKSYDLSGEPFDEQAAHAARNMAAKS